MSYRSSLRERAAGALRAEMARQKKTSVDLAHALNISQSSASRRMNGAGAIDLDEVQRWSDWLGVPVTYFFAETSVSA